MDSHDGFIEISNHARVLYSGYRKVARDREREKQAISRSAGRPDAETMHRNNYVSWDKSCDQYAEMLWRLADLVAKRLPKVYEDLRLVLQYAKWHTEREFDWTAAERELRRVEAAALQAAENGERTEQKPKQYLTNWREILVALGYNDNTEDREKVRYQNEHNDGPIRFPKQGAQPKVNKAKLIAWWNELEAQWEVGFNRARDSKPTVSDQHDYG
jgi:hypothetical protein